MMKMPEKGRSRDQILESLRDYRKADIDWREGKVFGYIFHVNDEAEKLVEEAVNMYLWENALDPTLFKSLLRMETEIVSMAAAHLQGDENVSGSFTSGGTESVMLAVKTARDWARKEKGIAEPEMILPITAHPCFHKAAHYFDIKAHILPVDPKTFKPRIEDYQKAMNANTALLVGSAPSYAHGVVDPIAEIAALAQENGILMHVDGCIGGFMLPYFRKLGADVTPFDFSVPGVTSMSMDLHKYAFAAKGASVVLYRTNALRKHQLFAWSNWTGYTLINPTIQSSKSGGPLAGAWAVLNFLGEEGYLEAARNMKEATDQYIAGINGMKDFYILGEPEMSLVATASDTLNIFEVCDELAQRGWHVQPQPGVDGLKENFHITIMPQHVPNIDQLLKDIAEVAELVRGRQPSELVATMKGMLGAMKPEDLTDEGIQNMLGMVGVGGGSDGAPDRMAEVNEILQSLPPEVADKLLTGFYNELNRYRETK